MEDLFHHALAVLHDPAYREANAGALRMEWPRIPLPGWPDGDAPDAAGELLASRHAGPGAGRAAGPGDAGGGRDHRDAAPGAGGHRRAVHRRRTQHDRRRLRADRRVGPLRHGDAVMPGQGRAVERAYTAAEREALGDAVGVLGDVTVDVHLNDNARTGATSPPPSGTTSWAATRC